VTRQHHAERALALVTEQTGLPLTGQPSDRGRVVVSDGSIVDAAQSGGMSASASGSVNDAAYKAKTLEELRKKRDALKEAKRKADEEEAVQAAFLMRTTVTGTISNTTRGGDAAWEGSDSGTEYGTGSQLGTARSFSASEGFEDPAEAVAQLIEAAKLQAEREKVRFRQPASEADKSSVDVEFEDPKGPPRPN
jgi:hypothetical protein